MRRLAAGSLVLVTAGTAVAGPSERAWELTQLAETEARAGNCARVAELRPAVVDLDPGIARDVFDRDVAIARCEEALPALKAAVAERIAPPPPPPPPPPAPPPCDHGFAYLEPYALAGVGRGTTLATRTSIGAGNAGCEHGGWHLIGGVYVELGYRTLPGFQSHGEASVGALVELGFRIPDSSWQIGPRVAVGVTGGPGGATTVTAGVMLRGDRFAFGLEGLHGAGDGGASFTQITIGAGVTSKSLAGTAIVGVLLGLATGLAIAAAAGGN